MLSPVSFQECLGLRGDVLQVWCWRAHATPRSDDAGALATGPSMPKKGVQKYIYIYIYSIVPLFLYDTILYYIVLHYIILYYICLSHSGNAEVSYACPDELPSDKYTDWAVEAEVGTFP